MYAWRRTASNKMEEKKGLDAARKLLHHGPNSASYRKYYDRGLSGLDLYAIATGEDEVDTLEPAALRRVTQWSIDRVAFLRKFVDEDDEVIKLSEDSNMGAEQKKEFKKAQRRAYYAGSKALEKLEKSVLDETLTTDEIHDRRKALASPTDFMLELKKLAATADNEMQEACPPLPLPDPDDPSVTINGDNDYDNEDPTEDLLPLYQSLLTFLITPRQPPGASRECPLCLEDSTIEEIYVAPSESRLRRHLGSKLHTKRQHFLRKYEQLQLRDNSNKVQCPFGCGSDYYKYNSIHTLNTDISLSGVLAHCHSCLQQSDEHLLLAAEEGIFDDDFETGIPSIHTIGIDQILPPSKKRKVSTPTTQTRKKRKVRLPSIKSWDDMQDLTKNVKYSVPLINYVPVSSVMFFPSLLH